MNTDLVFDTLADPRRAAVLGAAGGALKGLLVGAVVGKWLWWMSLGAAAGAAGGYVVARLAPARQTGPEWEAA
jgi:hypothetical protein